MCLIMSKTLRHVDKAPFAPFSAHLAAAVEYDVARLLVGRVSKSGTDSSKREL